LRRFKLFGSSVLLASIAKSLIFMAKAIELFLNPLAEANGNELIGAKKGIIRFFSWPSVLTDGI